MYHSQTNVKSSYAIRKLWISRGGHRQKKNSGIIQITIVGLTQTECEYPIWGTKLYVFELGLGFNTDFIRIVKMSRVIRIQLYTSYLNTSDQKLSTSKSEVEKRGGIVLFGPHYHLLIDLLQFSTMCIQYMYRTVCSNRFYKNVCILRSVPVTSILSTEWGNCLHFIPNRLVLLQFMVSHKKTAPIKKQVNKTLYQF